MRKYGNWNWGAADFLQKNLTREGGVACTLRQATPILQFFFDMITFLSWLFGLNGCCCNKLGARLLNQSF